MMQYFDLLIAAYQAIVFRHTCEFTGCGIDTGVLVRDRDRDLSHIESLKVDILRLLGFSK